MSATALERLVRRDRAAAAIALAAVAALAWAYLVRMGADMGADMGDMPGMATAALRPWSAADFLLLFAMWAVMMMAMMLPSAAPMILLVAGVARRRRAQASPAVSTGAFVAGYLLVWTGFSAAAALAQSGLHHAALLSPAMASASPGFSGLLLIAAGIYQWLPLKSVCLARCRSPLGFLDSEWREGRTGALAMGVRHGLHCLGCCWTLMALLFVAGVMNLLWIALLAALVLLEKVAPRGGAIGRAAGVLFVGWGAYLIVTHLR